MRSASRSATGIAPQVGSDIISFVTQDDHTVRIEVIPFVGIGRTALSQQPGVQK